MQTNMLSLYDYLGYAAGSELGKQVGEYATIKKTKCDTRHVSNPKYTGDIMLYEKAFLDEFFQVKKLFAEPDYTELNTILAEEAFNNTDKVL